MGRLIVIVGKTCSGKTTLARYLSDEKGYRRIITYTTRPPREGEVDGVDYKFVTDQKFKDLVNSEMMLETATYVLSKDLTIRYGSLYADYISNKDLVVVLNPAGVMQLINNPAIMARKPLIVWLDIPDYILVARLLGAQEESIYTSTMKIDDWDDENFQSDRGTIDNLVKRFEADAKDFAKFEKDISHRNLNVLRIWSPYTPKEMADTAHILAGMEKL